ncbi:Retrovirus-related Pol polyprotein [Thelohanellus kitauei]|uniref:Retrovirus-related Pol polyprotein n=1 Tax=Thelohanellus kitauei TaxID=669202 RepID=A0A0C2JWN7_THEKT|nr:Retrovirus-related Pol polyprotein [Thelohanellus kitauei]
MPHLYQGPQYESHKLTEFCNALNIIKSHSSVYHPEGNGLAERAIQTFKQKLKALVNGNPDSWDEKIEEVLWAMRNTYGKATGYTPAELVYNTSLRSPSDAKLIPFAKMLRINDEHLIKVKENINRHATKYKGYYDRSTTENQFTIGQQVLLEKPSWSGFDSRYDGPYTITKKRYPDYKIKSSLNGSETVVHHNRLKLYKNPGCVVNSSDDEFEDNMNIEREPEARAETMEKRRIKIPAENLEFVKKNLPSFLERGGMSEMSLRNRTTLDDVG